MRIYNNNPEFGHERPFDSDATNAEAAKEEFADEMKSNFLTWAEEAYGEITYDGDVIVDHEAFIPAEMARLRAKFIKGLEVL